MRKVPDVEALCAAAAARGHAEEVEGHESRTGPRLRRKRRIVAHETTITDEEGQEYREKAVQKIIRSRKKKEIIQKE